MKKLALLLSLCLTFALGLPVNANNPGIEIQLNGEVLTFDVAPVMENSRVLVPIRGLFEKLGAGITWDGHTSTITIETEDQIIELVIGENNGKIIEKSSLKEVTVELDVAPRLVKGRTMIPLRFVTETLNTQTHWDGTSQTVRLETPDSSEKPLDKPLVFSELSPLEWQENAKLMGWIDEHSAEEGIYSINIDGNQYLLVAAGMKLTGGYHLTVEGVYSIGEGKVYVEAILETPAPGDMVTEALTYPTALILIDGSHEISTLKLEISETTNVGAIGEDAVEYTLLSPYDLEENSTLTNWYNAHFKTEGIHSTKVDGKLYILFAAGERKTGGYYIEINSIHQQAADSLYLDASVINPDPDMMVTQEISYPHILIELDAPDINDVDGFIFTPIVPPSFN